MLEFLHRWGGRKVFIDCGGNNGSSVRKFRRDLDSACRFDVISFEPNPLYAPCYAGFAKHELLPYAVWTENGQAEFFLDSEDGDGSTLMREKLTKENGGYGVLDREHPLRVQTIDISSWLAEHFEARDKVYLKLDIEGAEYDVLEKMLRDGTLKLVDRLFIEWHWSRVGVSEERHRSLVAALRKAGVRVDEWDAREGP